MKNRPNILWIMTDQQRYDCLGASGNPWIRTPNLDRLAGESAQMQSCFVQAPVCVPSRQTFFTGRYPRCHRNRVNYTPLNDREVLLQAHMRRAGYATAFVGKLHYYPPTREQALASGFDRGLLHDAAQCDRHSDYVAWLRQAAPQYLPDYRAVEPVPGGNPFRARIPDEFHETTWCGSQSRQMLRELASRDQPFFLFSSYWRPHPPFEVPEPWASMYDTIEPPLAPPEQMTEEYLATKPLPVRVMAERTGRPARDVPRDRLAWMWRAYAAAISQIDREVGLTLDLLDDLHLADNTLVIFCSDHGEQMLEHAIVGKNVFYEASVHVPLLVRLPRIVQPGPYEDLVESTDVFAALFELCGLPVPPNQGRSVAGHIAPSAPAASIYAPRQYVFAENIIPEVITHGRLNMPYVPGEGVGGIRHPDAKMVRSQRHKYCHYVGHGTELYDLLHDPREMHNLADDPQYASVVLEMRTALLEWMITADESDQIAPCWGDV